MLLVIIGGLLILFIYITRLVSNEKFKFNPIILFLNGIILIIILLINLNENFNFTLLNKPRIIFIYNLNNNFRKFITSNSIIIILIIIYLLITIIAVVKISTFKSGPLRQKF